MNTQTPTVAVTTDTSASTGQAGGGVYLTQVPYTGIGSNVAVVLFILALALWTAAVSYVLVRRHARARYN